jgi:tetratricopeptide (TPR) repeat protein
LLTKGEQLEASGDYLRAEQYLAAALAAGAGDRAALPALLHACIAARHYRLGSEYADAALTRDPSNSRLRFMTAALFLAIGERGRAREQFELAASQLGGDADVQFAVAVFFRDEMSDPVSADPYFRKYLQVSPTGAHAGDARGSLMERVQ